MEQLEIIVDDNIVLRLHHEKMAPLLFELVEKTELILESGCYG